MPAENRFSANNPLLKRVRRHANAAVIFRAPEAGAARPFPAAQVRAADILGEITFAPQTAVQARLSPVPAAAPQPSALPVQTAAPVSPVQLAAATPGPAAPEPAKKPTGDAEWGRLKRILRGHEQKQTGENPQGTPAADVQRAVTAAEAPSAVPAPEAPPRRAPLETAWPVQSTKPALPEEVPPQITEGKPIAPPPDPAQEQLLRAKLDQVSASKPTDSSIEVLLPRRPRPVLPPKEPPPPPKKLPFLQKKEEQARETAVPQTVETEIGPLPADMWELLGEAPPGESPQAEPSAVTPESSSAQVQRASAAAEAPSTPESPAKTPPDAPQAIPAKPAAANFPAPATSSPVQWAAAAAEAAPAPESFAELPAAPTRPETPTAPPVETAVPVQPPATALQRAISAAASPTSAEPPQERPKAADQPETREADAAETAKPAPSPTEDLPQTTRIQRAIAAAESPPVPAPTVVPTTTLPISEIPAEPQPQPPEAGYPRSGAAKDTSRTPTPPAPPDFSVSTDLETAKHSASPPQLQRAIAATEAQAGPELKDETQPATLQAELPQGPMSSPQGQQATAPAETQTAPELKGAPPSAASHAEPPQTPTASPQPPAPSPLVQRAIAAAEAPPSLELLVEEPAAPSQPEEPIARIVKTAEPTQPHAPADAPARPETKTEVSPAALQAKPPEALVASTQSPTPSPKVQRTIAEAEATARLEPKAEVPIAGEQPAAANQQVQRAIAAAEAPAQPEPKAEVSFAGDQPPAPSQRVQRASAAAEASPAPSTPEALTEKTATLVQSGKQAKVGPETAEPDKLPAASAPRPTSVQRAIAAAEAPLAAWPAPPKATVATFPAPPATPQPGPSISSRTPVLAPPAPQVRVQRAIAAAEAPALPRPLEAKRQEGRMETAVTPPPPATIPTPIGPLPADLWELLGEKPPAPRPGKTSDLMRAVAVAESAPALKSTPKMETPPPMPVVQRVTEGPAAQLEPADLPETGRDAEETEVELDVDELARQVYAAIKRRLAADRERGRGRW